MTARDFLGTTGYLLSKEQDLVNGMEMILLGGNLLTLITAFYSTNIHKVLITSGRKSQDNTKSFHTKAKT